MYMYNFYKNKYKVNGNGASLLVSKFNWNAAVFYHLG